MAQFSRLEVLNEIISKGLVPVFHNNDFEISKKIIESCVAGGVRTIEFTNRGDNAYRVFSDLVQYFAKANPKVILGVGSVIDAPTGALFIASGANFVVGPVLNTKLAQICNRHKISYSPGCGSTSEISLAEELGVEIVKIFPGDSVGGPKFVKSILGPTPWTRLMPTGGVIADQGNIKDWFTAGVSAVGLGSNLIKTEWVKEGNFQAITKLTQKLLTWIECARGNNIFKGLEHVGLYPKEDVAPTVLAKWYQNRFGFQTSVGNSSIMVNDPTEGSIEVMKETNNVCHIAIKVSNFEAAIENLRGRGIEIEEPIIKPGFKAVYLKENDPNGNRIHLICRE